MQASSFCGAECLQKVCYREQESVAANGEHICSLLEKAAVVLLDLTVFSYRLPWHRNSLWFVTLS